MELQILVETFIKEKSEGGYWDFKQYWHSNNADLLKDIICMANNTTNNMQDGYIIFGIEDSTYKITGISEDSNRKNQENVIGFLSSQIWAGEEVPIVEVKTIEIDSKEVDVLVIHNSDVTPYYLLKDYTKSNNSDKTKMILRAGVVYSRVGDRNTSSAECATKSSMEFLWKKRFGLSGTDEYKVIKRLQNIDSWYSTDEYKTIYNSEYGDIRIECDRDYRREAKISEESPETRTWVMDFPYLFTNSVNWDIGKDELGWRLKWDFFLNNRKLNISVFGVQVTRQTYYHIEPNTYWANDLDMYLGKMNSPVKYYAYIQDSIKYLAYNLFLSKQCYKEEQKLYNNALTVIPVFESEQEHTQFMEYVNLQAIEFKNAVSIQNIDEMFPVYSQNVDSVVIYKLGKTLVQWLAQWRQSKFK